MFLSRKILVFLRENISTPPVNELCFGRQRPFVYLNTNIYYPSQEEQAEESDDQIQIILADYFAFTKRCNARIGYGSTKKQVAFITFNTIRFVICVYSARSFKFPHFGNILP